MGRPQLSACLTPILLPDFPTVFITLAAQGQRKVVTVPLHTVIASSRPRARLEQALRVPAKQMTLSTARCS